MKRLTIMVALLTLGYAAGASFPVSTRAQAPAAPPPAQGAGRAAGGAPGVPCGRSRGNAPDGKCTDEPRAASNMFISRAGEELRAKPGKATLYTRDQQNAFRSHFEWTPQYRLTTTVRQGVEPGKEPVDGELHTDNTQLYFVTAGSGTVIVEGTVAEDKQYLVAPGEYRGGPITGGRVLKIKAGDLVSIPPMTWHNAWGDPGAGMTYVMVHINTRTTIP